MLLPLHLLNLLEGAGAIPLNTINGGEDGMILLVRRDTSQASSITVEHAVGNIYLDGAVDRTLDSDYDCLFLMYVEALSAWIEVDGDNS